MRREKGGGMKREFSVGAIQIVQWLNPEDPETGRALKSELDALVARHGLPIQVAPLRIAETKAAFLSHLAEIAREAKTRWPIVQIETHGAEWGIGRSATECIEWAELKGPLAEINIACRLNLVVVNQACWGEWLRQVVRPPDPAPVRGFIGPSRKLEPDEITRGNSTFYRSLFSSFDLGIACAAMNAAIPSGTARPLFVAEKAEDLFRLVVQNYFETHCSTDRLDERVAALSATAAKAGLPDRTSELRSVLSDRRQVFEWIKTTFFFIDACPENGERFPITFEECLPQEA
jgi:hypothetical protein